jgi:hypothetical protein
MKKIYTLIAAALLATGAAAQNPTAYFMEGSTFRSQFNPAFAPLRGYVNIPAIGGVNINVGGNIAVDNILFSRDGKLVTLLDCRTGEEPSDDQNGDQKGDEEVVG